MSVSHMSGEKKKTCNKPDSDTHLPRHHNMRENCMLATSAILQAVAESGFMGAVRQS